MTNTPNLGLPYPELADTADVPRDIKALAVKLDTLLGGGGGGGGGSGSLPLAAAPVGDVGRLGQVRAGRELTAADFTSLGLSVPVGLFNLSSLVNLGSAGPLVNLGAVPFGVGINGLAATAAVFAGSTGQALYIADTGAADPFRIRTGSWGCWMRTAKRGVDQQLVSKLRTTGSQQSYMLNVSNNVAQVLLSPGGATNVAMAGVSDVADDRWHFAVATHDATVQRLYVDGVLEASSSAITGPLFSSSAPFNIGAFDADGATAAVGPHYGRIDEAFVTADVLTDDQVRLLYACRLIHGLGTIPTGARLNVHRRRKGAALAVADFPVQPVRLHNFTGGALTDQGSGGVALVAVGGGSIADVAGADGTPANAKSFSGAHSGLAATDAGLPGGLTTRSYGCWFKAVASASVAYGILGWGTSTTAHALLRLGAGAGQIVAESGADSIVGPAVGDGQWHHVVEVEDNAAGDGVRRKLYVDGRLVGASTVLNAITLAGASVFRIGQANGGAQNIPLTGQIDGAFITGVALTAADIAGLYAKGAQDLGASPKEPGQHVERLDATSVLFIADTLEPQHTIDLGVVA